MDFDLKLCNNDLTIYCSRGLKVFSNEFINYYKNCINKIKEKLGIDTNVELIVALTDDVDKANFVYGKSDFSGFYNDTGAFAYINLHGKKDKDYMFKRLMHELTHHLYEFYVYGKNNERITWVDEGIAQFISNQKDDLQDDDSYNRFLEKNLTNINNIKLNELNHDDKSFGNNNGYNISYIAIRYLYEINKHEDFINIISNHDRLLEIGNSILNDVCKYYNINN